MSCISIPADTENCLNYLLSKGHNIERQCLQGHCGSCRLKLVEGSVTYEEEPLAWIGEGEFLPCCAKPTTDLVVSVYHS